MIRISTLCLFLFVTAGVAFSADEKPNILFIFADDQCYETISAYGLTDIDTPNLDRLAEKGTTFTHAYNMGSWSGAVCVASRHMLNTGAFVWHAEEISKQIGSAGKKAGPKAKDGTSSIWPDFQEKGQMWSQLMAKAGYDTYFTGKWHVKAKAEQIFHVARNVRGGDAPADRGRIQSAHRRSTRSLESLRSQIWRVLGRGQALE